MGEIAHESIYVRESTRLMHFSCYAIDIDVYGMFSFMTMFLKPETVIYVAFDGCNFQNRFFELLPDRLKTGGNRINFINFNPECGDYDMSDV